MSQQDDSIKQEVEIALLYKVLSFVRLPNNLMPNAFVLCFTNNVPNNVISLQGKELHGKKVLVRPLKTDQADSTSCTALFGVALSHKYKNQKIVEIARQPLKCSQPNAQHIGIYLRDDKFAFDLNLVEAEKDGFQFELGLIKRARNLCKKGHKCTGLAKEEK